MLATLPAASTNVAAAADPYSDVEDQWRGWVAWERVENYPNPGMAVASVIHRSWWVDDERVQSDKIRWRGDLYSYSKGEKFDGCTRFEAEQAGSGSARSSVSARLYDDNIHGAGWRSQAGFAPETPLMFFAYGGSPSIDTVGVSDDMTCAPSEPTPPESITGRVSEHIPFALVPIDAASAPFAVSFSRSLAGSNPGETWRYQVCMTRSTLDSDGDGLPDGVDLDPQVAAVVGNLGVPGGPKSEVIPSRMGGVDGVRGIPECPLADPVEAPCDGLTTTEVLGTPPSYARPGGTLWDLAAFPNDDALCNAVWVPKLDAGFVPQGLVMRGDGTALIAGYDGDYAGKRGYGEFDGPCRIVAVNATTGDYVDQAVFRVKSKQLADGSKGVPRCKHGGGIHIDSRGDIWLASTARLYRIDPDLLFAVGRGDDAVIGSVKLVDGLKGSFLVPATGGMWLGAFEKDQPSQLFKYPWRKLRAKTETLRSKQLSATTAIDTRDIASHAQGAVFVSGTLLVSASNSTCGVLASGPAATRFGFGPGSEEIEKGVPGRVWAVHEAGTKLFDNEDAFFPVLAEYEISALADTPTCSDTIGIK